MMAPKFENLAKASEGKATFVKVDVEELEEIADEYGVDSLPTFAVIKNKQVVFKVAGSLWDNIEAEIKKHL